MATVVLPVVRNVISAATWATLQGTVLKVDIVGMDMVAVNTLATLAVVMVTWLVIAPTVRSVTTVSFPLQYAARHMLDMSRGIVPLKPGVNGFAINASSQATFKLPVLIRPETTLGRSSNLLRQYIRETRLWRFPHGLSPCSSNHSNSQFSAFSCSQIKAWLITLVLVGFTRPYHEHDIHEYSRAITWYP
ncbi:unnamed protein product [Aspergillus oryzae]|uniref:Unnamed protein product n=2 Tax=Aspergillus oryzae TaxID=5062 RepID=A0AAN4YMV8_ASPOZ|nr:unnamed protein product [Aspergillus oryzae]GMF84663.1 unnamed protein product [Aspergillus oryzae]GMG03310.1 unnamed protein product [Aspergillus oryzae]GMG34081.1 unnamed protein product [Aspergillus oryzae]GMG43818.1 unnamed protein product [Aspergillus oryzae var. brunneus]